MDPVSELYSAIGEDSLRRMVSAFYRRIREDDLIGPMYPKDDWTGSEKRLADFIIFRFGGPPTYIQERGHPRLRARHFPFPIGTAARDRWISLMNQSILETAIPASEAETIRLFFAQVADSMRNQPDA